MNPLPYSNSRAPPEFAPPCNETEVCRTKGCVTGKCSGQFPFDVQIVDAVKVPAHLAPGEYVLGFRWDCEKSAQVWASCADITVVAPAATRA